jgi:hypothetical protein
MGWPYLGWLYLGIALAAVSLAVLLRRLLTPSAGQRVDPWASLLLSAGCFIAYALAGEHDRFYLVMALMWLAAGGLELRIVP